jgi:hypothetical protein
MSDQKKVSPFSDASLQLTIDSLQKSENTELTVLLYGEYRIDSSTVLRIRN